MSHRVVPSISLWRPPVQPLIVAYVARTARTPDGEPTKINWRPWVVACCRELNVHVFIIYFFLLKTLHTDIYATRLLFIARLCEQLPCISRTKPHKHIPKDKSSILPVDEQFLYRHIFQKSKRSLMF